jgi:tRNA (guanine37-N1)-methyltransferase
VILDKNPHINVVVTKLGSLSNEFRTFCMEVIASRNGDKSLVANVSENKMKLVVDYEKCYWNSRLSFERERLMKKFLSTHPGQSRLVDMCCGIGALACFSARAGLEVFANDLNPDAVRCLRMNAQANRVELASFNMDARAFVRELVQSGKFRENKTNHVMINLPEIGLEFLDVFRDLFGCESELGENQFHIYCHCFSRENPPKDARSRALKALGLDADDGPDIQIIHIRDVAPNKIMYSVEFVVPRSLLVKSKRPRLGD